MSHGNINIQPIEPWSAQEGREFSRLLGRLTELSTDGLKWWQLFTPDDQGRIALWIATNHHPFMVRWIPFLRSPNTAQAHLFFHPQAPGSDLDPTTPHRPIYHEEELISGITPAAVLQLALTRVLGRDVGRSPTAVLILYQQLTPFGTELSRFTMAVEIDWKDRFKILPDGTYCPLADLNLGPTPTGIKVESELIHALLAFQKLEEQQRQLS